jgi:transposase
LLRTIPGAGKILALVMLYEIHGIRRFERIQYFTSYARWIKPHKESAEKLKGGSNKKRGKVYLKCAFPETVYYVLRERKVFDGEQFVS